uniref:Uncharacterized protein n=1 Tax=Candidatus Kentrum sp. TUN TaxID=2126343 RepID=A0A451A6A0_9GAMM|nr:MAG: hypothetical protein BECKTUN1418E_GA0071001_10687 [Candidatus Kentron sp. TUN]
MRIEIVKHAVLFVRAPPTWGANNKIIQLTKTIPMKNNHAFRDGQNLSMKTCKVRSANRPCKINGIQNRVEVHQISFFG